MNDEQRGHRMRGGVDAPQVELGAAERAGSGDEHRHDIGSAAGQHRVDRNHASGALAKARWEHRQHLVGVGPAARRQHRFDPFDDGRHEREPVSPSAVVEVVHDRFGRRVDDFEKLPCVSHGRV